jgi:hypothetical protein
LILVVFGGVAFLVPLAIYCLILAMLNRRWHPTMVAGPWDFAGVLFALSGFLLVGGPCLLTGLNKQWRSLWLTGRLRDVSVRSADWWHFWLVLWAGYFVAVVGGAALVLWLRRRSTAVYNITPGQLDDAVNRTLTSLGLPATRVANQFFIHARKDAVAKREVDPVHASAYVPADAVRPELSMAVRTEPAPPPADEVALVLRVDSVPTLRHATLTWSESEALTRKQVELELARQLAEVAAPDNPLAGWLMTISASLFSIAFVCLLLLVGYVVLLYGK